MSNAATYNRYGQRQSNSINHQDITNQLTKFGYSVQDINDAINVVNNLNDINKIIDQIEKQENKKMERDYNMFIVMRHSKRIDQHPKFAPHLKWNEKDQFLRPYDPPICDFKLPLQKIKEIQSLIPTINITKIMVSPYLRCIQTATVIAKYLQIKTFEIDARLGEVALAINRCIKHAKNKQIENKKLKLNYKIPNDYNDVVYLTIDQIKKIILDLYNHNVNDNNNDNKDDDDDEQKHCMKEDELMIEWKHKEKPGNQLHIECIKEYKTMLMKQQELENKDKIRNDILMISHGDIVSNVSEVLCGKILTVDECGWICITHNQSAKIYSPTSVQILFDKYAQTNM